MKRRVSITVFATCFAAFTAPNEARLQRPTVRDSAGIRIVENVEAAWAGHNAWRVGDRPALDIGAREGDPGYELYQVVGAAKLGDGRIVVGNAGTLELRFYDSAGRYIRSTGGRGQGPGEFSSIQWLGVTGGDSILVYDVLNALRISVFDSHGQFVRSIRLQPMDGRTPDAPVGVFADGSLVIPVSLPTATTPRRTPVRFPSRYVRHAPDGTVLNVIATTPDHELFIQGVPAQLGRVAYWDLAFGRRASVRVHGDRVFVGEGTTFEIHVYTSAGLLQAIIRRAHQPLAVTPDDIERYKQRMLRSAEGPFRSVAERMLAEMPYPDSMPAFAGIAVDPDGFLWVEEYRRPGDRQPRWTVFDQAGAMLGTVVFPERFRLFQVGGDFVLGRWQDELDVEHVQLYELIKDR